MTNQCKKTAKLETLSKSADSHMLGVLEAKTEENEAEEIARGKKYKTTSWTRKTELSVLKGTQASSSMKENRFTPRYIFMKF